MNRVREVSLVDLWLVLVRYRSILFWVFVLCVTIGIVYAYFRHPAYVYSTSIEIGRMVEDNKSVLIESPDTAVAKLSESYIPAAVAKHRGEHPDDEFIYRPRTRIPKKSDLVVMEIRVTEDRGRASIAILRDAVDSLVRDHQRITRLQLAEFEQAVNRAQLGLNGAILAREELEEQAELIKSSMERLDESERLTNKQLTQLDELINESLKNRAHAVQQNLGQAQAMTVLLLDSELEDNRTRQAQLEKYLHIELKSERERTQKALADNRRAQDVQRQEIAVLEQDLKAFEVRRLGIIGTTALAEPTRSLLPHGPGKGVVILMSIIMGVIGGVVVVFFTAFLAKVNETLLQQRSKNSAT